MTKEDVYDAQIAPLMQQIIFAVRASRRCPSATSAVRRSVLTAEKRTVTGFSCATHALIIFRSEGGN